jgi:hypothetical protein
MGSVMPDWIRTLIIALVTSLFTVCLIEPVSALIQRWLRRRELRRSLYREMVLNFQALDGQVAMAKSAPEMRKGIPDRFGRSFRKSSFDLAHHDPAIYYDIGFGELYWIELFYSNVEHIVTGHFPDDDKCVLSASFAADSLLVYMKNRWLNKRLVLRVSPFTLRAYFRERLASTNYVDTEPPTFFEKIRRTLD